MNAISIIGFGGSLGEQSKSLGALRVAMQGVEQAGATGRIFDLHQMNIPMYVPGLHPTADVEEFCEAIYCAQGMIWSSPLYHGSVSGAFKNALDWLQLLSHRDPPYLKDRIIGLISTAGGIQGLQAINTMEFIVRSLRAWAVPLVIPIPRASQIFDAQGQLKDQQIYNQLCILGGEVVRAANEMAVQGHCEYSVR